ncbi:MAG TPA: carboxymuconolactone decarboxylase family protein [Chryseolinea sp.]
MEPRLTLQDAPRGMYELMSNIETYLKKSGISHSLIHLIKVRASQINRCGYCLDMHHKDTLKAGETFQRLYLLPAWKESPMYSDAEKAVLNLTEVVTRISESEPEVVADAYERLTPHFSKGDIANIILAITQINSWNRIAITFGNVPGSYKIAEYAAV